MRRFIYLDTEALNSYIAQIYDGLLKTEDVEYKNISSEKNDKKFSGGLAGKIAMKLFGRGVEGNVEATFEQLKSIENEEMVRDVQTKILHDNAFDQFIRYLEDNKMIVENSANIGDFVSFKDEFYIFDIQFYKDLFEKNGFISILEEIQKKNTEKEASEKLESLPREQRRSKDTQLKIKELTQESVEKNHENYESAKMLIELLASLIPYPQIMCIRNYIVVLDEIFLRDSLKTAAFKYGGKIHVAGYVTNKIDAQSKNPSSAFAGINDSFNAVMSIFFENSDDMFVIHPIAIYYEN